MKKNRKRSPSRPRRSTVAPTVEPSPSAFLNRRRLLGGGISLTGLIAGGYALTRPGPDLGAPADDAVLEHVLGDRDSANRVVAYVSFTCVHCAVFHQTVWPWLKREYVDKSRISYTLREVAFDQYGLWAASLARRAGPGRFYKVADLLLDSQRRWIHDDPEETRRSLIAIGEQVGMPISLAEKAFTDIEAADNLRQWIGRNVKRDGIDATPSFIVNGRRYGNMPQARFAELLGA